MPAPDQVIVLGSSSPLPAPLGPSTWDLPFHHSSSPPVQLQVVRKAPVLKGGSRAEQIPVGAAVGFRSARDIVAELGLREDAPGENGEEKVKKGRKRKSDEMGCGRERAEEEVVRQSEAKGTGKLKKVKKTADKVDTAVKKPRQGKKKKVDTAGPTDVDHPPDTGKVDKSGLEKALPQAEKATLLSVEEDKVEVKATFKMPRLLAQTPPPQTGTEVHGGMLERRESQPRRKAEAEAEAEHETSRGVMVEGDEEAARGLSTFANLVGAFGYNGQVAPSKDSTTSTKKAAKPTEEQPKPRSTTKQKSGHTKTTTPVPEPAPKPVPVVATKPQKAPAKSSRTVTKIVLAQYQSPEKPTENTVLSYDAKMLQPLELTADGSTKKKRVSKSRSKKNAPPPPVKLLSPSQLKRRLQCQDTLFGTSSQLAAEDSPKTIRALQQAYRESEASIVDLTTPIVSSRRSLGASSVSKGLWSAATRGDDDFMFAPTQKDSSHLQQGSDTEEFADIDLLEVTTAFENVAKVAEDQSLRLRLSSVSKKPGPRMRIANSLSFEMPSPPVVVQSASMSTSAGLSPPNEVALSPPTLVEDASSKISSNETQPNRSKVRPPKDDTAMAPPASAGQDPPVKKRRGRPPKDPSAPPKPRKPTTKRKKMTTISAADEFMPIEDAIVDPEPPLTPSPPHRRASPTKPLPLNLSPSSAAITANAAPSNRDEKTRKPVTRKEDRVENITRMGVLFPRITQAVKNAPRGTQQNPSWWEKMLLYDPIVLEDFAAWLNDIGLRQYGGMGATVESDVAQQETIADLEESAGKAAAFRNTKIINDDDLWMVQKWCESNGICCLFKAGLRGGVRLVY